MTFKFKTLNLSECLNEMMNHISCDLSNQILVGLNKMTNLG